MGTEKFLLRLNRTVSAQDAQNEDAVENQIVSEQFMKIPFNIFRNYFICLSIFLIGYASHLEPDWIFLGRFAIFFSAILVILNTIYMILSILLRLSSSKQKLEKEENISESEKEESVSESVMIEKINLAVNPIFDHLSNYLLCAGFYLVGVRFLNDDSFIVSTLGWVTVLISLPFALLNGLSVISYIWTKFRPIRGKFTGMPRGQVVRFIILACYVGFATFIFVFTIKVKLEG